MKRFDRAPVVLPVDLAIVVTVNVAVGFVAYYVMMLWAG